MARTVPDSPGDRIMTGVGLRMISITFFACMSATIKLGETRGAGLGEMLFFRQFMAAMLVLAFVAIGPGFQTIRTTRLRAHVIRTGYGVTGMIFNFGALILLPLAEAVTLAYTAPIFATVFGALLLREPTGWHRWSAVALGFVGVLIVTQPGSGHIPLVGAAVGLTGAVITSLITIQLRELGRTDNSQTTVLLFSSLSCIPLGLYYAFHFQPHTPETWAILLSIGLFGGVAQLTMTASLRFAPVSVVAPIDYLGLIGATLLGWFLFDKLPTTATLIGAPIIVASGLYIVFREHRMRRSRPVELDL